jgi:hypothetical protein
MNYHSRLPAISARTPTGPVSAALVRLGHRRNRSPPMPAFMRRSHPAAASVGCRPAGGPSAADWRLARRRAHRPAGCGRCSCHHAALLSRAPPRQIAAGARTLGFVTTAATGSYLIEFPEDIHLVGGSFNTSLKGVALQGELSYRSSQPLQVDDVELLFAALSLAQCAAFGPNNQLGNCLRPLQHLHPGLPARTRSGPAR